MKNVTRLLQQLPRMGFGDPVVFSNKAEDYEKAADVLEGVASMKIILARAEHHSTTTQPTPYNQWLSEYAADATGYVKYMFDNYNFYRGEFQFDKTPESLEILAGIYNDYFFTEKGKLV